MRRTGETPWNAWPERSPSSPVPAAASDSPRRSCLPPRAPRSSSGRGARTNWTNWPRRSARPAANYAEALVALAVERYGRLDVAFNNAGTLGESGPSTSVSEAGWNDAIAINLTGSFLGAKHQIAQMLKNGGGSVIFTSTFVGYSFAFPGVAAYAASKSGLIGLTQALAAEFGPQGVRVNAILPGAVDTDMYRSMNSTAESQSFITNLHALKRVASADELARSVLYLASDDSAFVTGTASLVDGGASITRT